MYNNQSDDRTPSRKISDNDLEAIVGGGAGTISVNYPCDVCGESFRTYDALTRHTQQNHA